VRAGDGAYLDAVVKEVLRVRPVLSIAARRVAAPFEVAGHVLPPGVHVAPCIYLAHRRPEAWPEPTAFRPERFLGAAPAPGTYLPFGGGVRRCAGAPFAALELREVLRAVIARFALSPAGATTERMIRGSVTLRPSRGGRVLTEPLQPSRPCRSSAVTTA
jgi:cytochrome P450